MPLKNQYEIDCRECEGYGSFVLGHPSDPDAREIECDECGGTGREVVTGWDLESLLEAGAGITYEEAFAVCLEDGLEVGESDELIRRWGLTPTPALKEASA